VAIRLRFDPSHARVELDGVEKTESVLLLPRGGEIHQLVVSAPGYVTLTRELTATSDAELALSLKRAPASAVPSTKRQPSKPSATTDKSKPLKGPMEKEL
jgi:hypothetical protein